MEPSNKTEGPSLNRPLQPLPLASARARYVVLHHTGIADPHFDLMLQLDGMEKLLTWRVTVPPGQWPPPADTVERIADHRAAYMTFEGDLSGNRGTVNRVAQGEATLLASDDKTIQLRFLTGMQCDILLPIASATPHPPN